jgi:hypothetical protein
MPAIRICRQILKNQLKNKAFCIALAPLLPEADSAQK